jgi:hypothetical protein
MMWPPEDTILSAVSAMESKRLSSSVASALALAAVREFSVRLPF